MHPYFDLPVPHLFGHRGASGERPENTLAAFERAHEQGVPYLEMDCHATSDGEIVVIHDADLERTTNGQGPVREHGYAEIEKLDAGYFFSPDGQRFPYRDRGVRVPRLAQVLHAFPAARINLEVKQADPPIAEEVVRLLRKAGAIERTLLAAEHDPIMDRLHELDPGTAFGSSIGDVVALVTAVAQGRFESFEPRGHALQVPTEAMGNALVTPELIAAAHARGLLVHVWTINEPAEMRRLLELGVDGLMSDFPGRLIEVARR